MLLAALSAVRLASRVQPVPFFVASIFPHRFSRNMSALWSADLGNIINLGKVCTLRVAAT